MAKEQGLVKYESRGQEVVLTPEIVRDYLVTGKKELVSVQEIAYFLGICKARGLNPFVKDCYLIKYGHEPAAIITSIDFYRSRARAAADCVGWEKGVICLNKETKDLRYSKGLVLPDEELVGAWFRARPLGWTVDFELEVNLAGYIKKTAEGKITKFWSAENQPSQIAKVVESQGLRTVWPDLFQGTYTAEEMSIDLGEAGPPPPGSAGDITPRNGPPNEPPIDTSKFDKAVKKLKWDKETMSQLEKWLTETAAAASTSQKAITADMVKVSCAGRFEEFLAKFKEWQDHRAPLKATPEAIQGAREDWERGHPDETYPPDRAGEPPDSTDGIPLADRKQAAWREVISLGIHLADLAQVGVSSLSDINEDNIDALESLLSSWGKK